MATTQRGTAWSVTINNPTPSDDEEIALARQKGWKVEGQKEVGEGGTPHYQLLVRTPQVRFSAVKKAFSRAHIEPAKNVEALANYVVKEETRAGALPSTQDQYPSLSKLWNLMYIWLTESRGYKFDVPSGSSDARVPCRVRFVECSCRDFMEPLAVFDEFIKDMICAGYHVESIGVNPQTRSMWSNYWSAILFRELTAPTRRQPDRQTVVEEDVATELSLPSINALDEKEEVRTEDSSDSS